MPVFKRGHDPRSEASEIQRRIYQDMPPFRKWEEVLKMRALALDLKRAGLRQLHPDWSSDRVEAEVRKIFLYAAT